MLPILAMDCTTAAGNHAARRPVLSVVLCGDRLFQKYVVDACAKMEQQQPNYLRFNQNSFCS